MGKETSIEWTRYTFNPWWGCARASAACDHCCPETWAKRFGDDVWAAKAEPPPSTDLIADVEALKNWVASLRERLRLVKA